MRLSDGIVEELSLQRRDLELKLRRLSRAVRSCESARTPRRSCNTGTNQHTAHLRSGQENIPPWTSDMFVSCANVRLYPRGT